VIFKITNLDAIRGITRQQETSSIASIGKTCLLRPVFTNAPFAPSALIHDEQSSVSRCHMSRDERVQNRFVGIREFPLQNGHVPRFPLCKSKRVRFDGDALVHGRVCQGLRDYPHHHDNVRVCHETVTTLLDIPPQHGKCFDEDTRKINAACIRKSMDEHETDVIVSVVCVQARWPRRSELVSIN
jgi:hypothetical protein